MSTAVMKKENNLPVTQVEGSQTNPANLLQLAVQQNLDIEKLEKLMELQERWEKNQARKDFFAAISQFQYDCPPLKKNKVVDFELRNGGRKKYRYAPLGEIAETIKKPMKDNGLSHRWEIGNENGELVCSCIISHVSGHSETTTMRAGKDESGNKNHIQASGSTVTYLQRYSLIAALGLSTADDDDDANSLPTYSEPSHNQDNDIPAPTQWLNKTTTKEGKTLTTDWKMVTGELYAGTTTIEEICKKWKVKKTDKEELAKIKPIPKGSAPGIHSNPSVVPGKPYVISEKWKEKAAACATPQQVDLLMEKNIDIVNRIPEIKEFLEKRKIELLPPEEQKKEIGTLGRPMITPEQLKTSVEKIKAGDLQEYYIVLNDYSLAAGNGALLQSAYAVGKAKNRNSEIK